MRLRIVVSAKPLLPPSIELVPGHEERFPARSGDVISVDSPVTSPVGTQLTANGIDSICEPWALSEIDSRSMVEGVIFRDSTIQGRCSLLGLHVESLFLVHGVSWVLRVHNKLLPRAFSIRDAM